MANLKCKLFHDPDWLDRDSLFADPCPKARYTTKKTSNILQPFL